MYGFMRLIYPLVWVFNRFTNWVHKLTGAAGDPIVTESELISMVEHGEEEGTIEADEREIIERVFFLNDLQARDVMTPTRKMFSIDGRRSLEEILPELLGAPYSRVPLYGDDAHEILKVLHLRDVLRALAEGRGKTPAMGVGHPPLYVPENKRSDQLLTMLRKRKKHLAVVVDETGYAQGVVTLEDLIEELVGEIYDESDELPDDFMTLSDDSILVNGDTELRVIEEFFQTDLPGLPTDTVSYWILGHTARIPTEDEQFVLDGLDIRVQSASARRIHQVVLKRNAIPPEP